MVFRSRNVVVLSLTVLFFAVGYGLLWLAAPDNIPRLAESLVAAYLLAWGLYALVSNVPRHEIRIQFMLTTAMLLGIILVAEIPAWLRLIDYRQILAAPRGDKPWYRPGIVPDRELFWIHQPHDRLQGRYIRGNIGEDLCLDSNQPQLFALQYDHNGFRNEVDYTTADIAVIGDSYVESTMVPASALFTAVLAELQNRRVANLGMSGYGPQQELTVLERYALDLQPHTIVWMFYEGDDLANALEYETRSAEFSGTIQGLRAAWHRSFTKNALGTLVRLSQSCTPNPDMLSLYGKFRDAGAKETLAYVAESGAGLPLSHRDLHALRTVKAAIAEAYRLCRERRIQFVVVFAPTAYRVYKGLPNFEEVSEHFRGLVVNDLPGRFRAMMADISPDMQVVDLTPFLKAAAANGTLVFLPDDTHWSPEGHRVVAETLNKFQVGQPVQVAVTNAQVPSDSIINLARDAVIVRGAEGVIRYWNKGAQQLYGWTPKEAREKYSHSLLRTVFPMPLQSIEAELIKTGQWTGELVHRRRDGSQVIVHSRWELQRTGRHHESPLVVEINHEYPRQPAGAMTNDGLVDLTRDTVIIRNTDGTIRYWNKGAERMYGWLQNEALGVSSHRLLKTVFPQPLKRIEGHLWKTGSWIGTLMHRRHDGSQVIVRSRWELQRSTADPSIVVEINRRVPSESQKNLAWAGHPLS